MKTRSQFFNSVIMFSLFIFTACGQNKENISIKDLGSESELKMPENPYYSTTDTARLRLSDLEWKKVLSPEVYKIMRRGGTEPPFNNKYWETKTPGTYYCAACGNKLFRSETKFISSTGWPSFYKAAGAKSVINKADYTLGLKRTEVVCARCEGHLGHVFDDGPPPTGKRYCMNSVALDFISDKTVASGISKPESITLGGGCFWSIEAVFQRMKGIKSVVSGYSGGKTKDPTYEEVTTGKTGYVEVVQLTYDKNVTNIDEILKVFFAIHDPTTLNKQGADVGNQYRSVIFYKNEEQEDATQEMIVKINAAKVYTKPIVTAVEPLTNFYKAEEYHQNYYNKNKNVSYSLAVIKPKIEKFEKQFKD